MKNKRQDRILSIINNQSISTQDELIDALRADGMNVTQATVSRDIKKLGLIKISAGNGRYKYSAAHPNPEKHLDIFSDTIIKISAALHTIVISTYPGMAPAVAASLDSKISAEILGSIAGDDTILLICEDEVASQALKLKLNKMLKG